MQGMTEWYMDAGSVKNDYYLLYYIVPQRARHGD